MSTIACCVLARGVGLSGKATQLPISKIKTMMRMDPEVQMVGSDAAFLVTKATELFVQYLAYKASESTAANKRKTVQRKVRTGHQWHPGRCGYYQSG